ncbi:MAG: flagellar basal body P-ring protein FlgI [Pseudomonadota bacterium]
MIRVLVVLLALMATPSYAERVKDIASVAGVRENQLLGYGLVVGLDGSGDSLTRTRFTAHSLSALLNRYGITLPEGVTPDSKNIAAVMVSSTLPPFSKPGQRIDVTVSSLGDAKNLRGGSLLMTPLKGADGEIYALAQGNLTVSGFGIEGADGSKVTVNVPSSARVPNGATVERSVPTPFGASDALYFNLHTPDFTTAKRLADKFNTALGPGSATAQDAVTVRVLAPPTLDQRVGFLAYLEELEIEPGEAAARVIVNSRTGTIVIGSHVRVGPAAVTHGSLTVSVNENPELSQPNALAAGQTAQVEDTTIDIDEENNRMFLFRGETSLSEIVRAVNQVGAAPSDLVAILEALKEAGALQAQLIVI